MRIGACAALGVLALGLNACGGAPPKPTPAKVTLAAAADANPDSAGRASPIVVRVYQLKEEGAFQAADYFALVDKEQDTLGASLLAREEYELQPKESRTLELKIAPEARFVGAIAGFRDLRNSKWKVLTPVTATAPKKLALSVGKAEVTLAGN